MFVSSLIQDFIVFYCPGMRFSLAGLGWQPLTITSMFLARLWKGSSRRFTLSAQGTGGLLQLKEPKQYECFALFQADILRRRAEDTEPVTRHIEVFPTNPIHLAPSIHNYDTRSSKLFHIPKIRTNICKFSLRYQGPRFYNSLPSDFQSARTMTSFINGLKTSLIDF